MSHDVFISYCSHDRSIANAICAALEAKDSGIRCWIAPRDVPGGSEYATEIVNAIDRCRAMVLVFSAWANNSKDVGSEVHLAFTKEKVIVPVRIENVRPEGAMEYRLSKTHWLEALTPPIDARIGEVVGSIRRLLDRSQPDIAPVTREGGPPPAAPAVTAPPVVAPSTPAVPAISHAPDLVSLIKQHGAPLEEVDPNEGTTAKGEIRYWLYVDKVLKIQKDRVFCFKSLPRNGAGGVEQADIPDFDGWVPPQGAALGTILMGALMKKMRLEDVVLLAGSPGASLSEHVGIGRYWNWNHSRYGALQFAREGKDLALVRFDPRS